MSKAVRRTKNKGCLMSWQILSFLVKSLHSTSMSLPCNVVAEWGLVWVISLETFWLQTDNKIFQFSANQASLHSLKNSKEPWKPVILIKGVHRPYLLSILAKIVCFRGEIDIPIEFDSSVFPTSSCGYYITAQPNSSPLPRCSIWTLNSLYSFSYYSFSKA